MKLINNSFQCICCLGLLLFLVSCSKNEDLSPSNSTEPMTYTLPQGNHPYDDEILRINQSYNTTILYKFNSSDFRWNQVNKPLAFTAVPGDEAYVGQMMDFMFKNNLELGSAKFLKKLLPSRILLASSIWPLIENTKSPTLYDTVKTAPQIIVVGFGHLAIGVTNQTFLNYSNTQKLTLRGSLHYNLWQLALTTKQIEQPPLFALVTNYSSTNIGGLITQPNANGLLAIALNPIVDLQIYMQEIAKYNEAEFAAKYLIPTVDVNGLIRKKYNIIRAYYLSAYDTDVQVFGNAR